MNIKSKFRKNIISFGLVGGLLISSYAMAFAQSVNFKDTNNHWAKPYIKKLIDKGTIKGYPDSTFKPDGTITNAEFTKILISALGYKDLGNASEGHWASNYIEKAEELGLINKNEFDNKEDENINRGKMAEMIAKAIAKESEIKKDVITIFEDDNDIPQELKGYIDYASRTEILNGYPVEKYFNNPKLPVKVLEFKSNKALTRAETAKVIDRMLYVKENNIKPKEIINVTVEKFEPCKVQFDKPVFAQEGMLDADGMLGGKEISVKDLQFKVYGYEWRNLDPIGLPGGEFAERYALILDLEVINNTNKKMEEYDQKTGKGYYPSFSFGTAFDSKKKLQGFEVGQERLFYEEHITMGNSPEFNVLRRTIPPKSSIRGKYIFAVCGGDIQSDKNDIIYDIDYRNIFIDKDIPQIKPLNSDNYINAYPLYYK